MKEFVEKLIGRLEELGWVFADYYPDGTEIHKVRKKSVAYDDVISIANQLAEEMGVSKMENTTWIPCSERLPIGEEYRKKIDGVYYYKQIVTTTNDSDVSMCIGWYDQENEQWYDIEGLPYHPIAWMPLPEPYQKGE